MATSGLDSFLGYFVPILVIGFFVAIIYKGIKPQADAFFRWAGEKFKRRDVVDSDFTGSVIVYDNF